MKSRSTWTALVGLVALAAVLYALAHTGPQDSPEHRSTSDGPNGTSALRTFAGRIGRPGGAVEGAFKLPTAPGVLFVFTPTVPFSAGDVAEVRRWVEVGGTLVYAAESGDSRLDAALGLRRVRAPVDGRARPVPVLLGGVSTLKGATFAYPLRAAPGQVPILRNARGDVLGLSFRLKSGRVVALTEPTELTNQNVDQADNWRLASDLVFLGARGAPALFDEYHHGDIAGGGGGGWALAPWGTALLWAALALFLGFALRGRSFGPRLPLVTPGERPSSEYVRAVGRLLRRAGARGLTADVLLGATRGALAQRVGLGKPGDRLEGVLKQRAPALAADLERVEAALPDAAASEEALLAAAGAMHSLAYPSGAHPSGRKST
jgi:hypothetical protein